MSSTLTENKVTADFDFFSCLPTPESVAAVTEAILYQASDADLDNLDLLSKAMLTRPELYLAASIQQGNANNDPNRYLRIYITSILLGHKPYTTVFQAKLQADGYTSEDMRQIFDYAVRNQFRYKRLINNAADEIARAKAATATSATASEVAKESLTEADNWATKVQKMRAWFAGTRGLNIHACSDSKLKDYYDICISEGRQDKAALLQQEAANRRLAWATTAAPAKSTKAVTNVFDLTPDRFTADIAKKVYYARGITDLANDIATDIANFAVYLIFALSLGKVDLANEITDMFYAGSASALKQTVKSLFTEETAQAIADAFNSIKNLDEAIEKHDTLNPKLWSRDKILKTDVKKKLTK